MGKALASFGVAKWDESLSEEEKTSLVQAIEGGKVAYFQGLVFPLDEREMRFLNPAILDPGSKNISYDLKADSVKGTVLMGEEADWLHAMMKRYALGAAAFLKRAIPHYAASLIQGKTSFRPAEIEGRKSSKLKDDSLLHVDAFPSNPTHGQRILRLFTNVNPHHKPRVWRVGEPFADVVGKMEDHLSRPLPGTLLLLNLLKITKRRRSLYDHYMLQMHNAMKRNASYQKNVPQEEIRFPAGSSWMVYTDQVSHAALSGQHVFEQTFHLPVRGLKDESTAPLRVLERHFKAPLSL